MTACVSEGCFGGSNTGETAVDGDPVAGDTVLDVVPAFKYATLVAVEDNVGCCFGFAAAAMGRAAEVAHGGAVNALSERSGFEPADGSCDFGGRADEGAGVEPGQGGWCGTCRTGLDGRDGGFRRRRRRRGGFRLGVCPGNWSAYHKYVEVAVRT
jgi:hypothetical protein